MLFSGLVFLIPEQSLVRTTPWAITLQQTFRAIAGKKNQSTVGGVSRKQEFTVTDILIRHT